VIVRMGLDRVHTGNVEDRHGVSASLGVNS
jgi:hypothetical protein